MRPVIANVSYFVVSALEIMFVMAGRVAILVMICIIVSKYVYALFVSGVIGISHRPSFLSCVYSPDLKVFHDIEDDVIVAENVPGNLASFQGRYRDF